MISGNTFLEPALSAPANWQRSSSLVSLSLKRLLSNRRILDDSLRYGLKLQCYSFYGFQIWDQQLSSSPSRLSGRRNGALFQDPDIGNSEWRTVDCRCSTNWFWLRNCAKLTANGGFVPLCVCVRAWLAQWMWVLVNGRSQFSRRIVMRTTSPQPLTPARATLFLGLPLTRQLMSMTNGKIFTQPPAPVSI